MILLLLACKGDDADTKTPGRPDLDDPLGFDSEILEATTNRNGVYTVPVEVTSEDDVFQLIIRRNRGMADVEQIYDPDGNLVLDWEDWYDSKYSLTECFYPAEFAATCNWPVRATDGPLQPGTWEVVVAAIDTSYNYDADANLEIEVLRRTDPTFATGELSAVIAYATGVRDEEGVEAAVEAAAEYWIEIYAAVGITLTVEYDDIDVDPDMPDTYQGQDAYQEFMAARDERGILVVIGETIADDQWTYGEAGAIPGPYGPAELGAVEVAWLANAGSDANFSDADVLLMGETMAHEVGHYLGLFHPVEWDYAYWDALEDTTECTGMTRCDEVLGTNLMYPYPVCTTYNTSSCTRQDELTAEQSGVLHRYVGVQ